MPQSGLFGAHEAAALLGATVSDGGLAEVPLISPVSAAESMSQKYKVGEFRGT
ncbi:MAG: hypothetical protein JWN21_2247 [Sphingomonas bacterium]|nr:hypothetical protein [Sphingomonas bacterium]